MSLSTLKLYNRKGMKLHKEIESKVQFAHKDIIVVKILLCFVTTNIDTVTVGTILNQINLFKITFLTLSTIISYYSENPKLLINKDNFM